MPTILQHKGYRFFFFSNEGTPREPRHVHVRRGKNVAKFWIDPDIILAGFYGMKSHELFELMRIIRENRQAIERAWDEFFGEHGP